MLLLVNIILLLALIVGGYWFSASKSELYKYYWPGLIFKLTMGICLGLVYSIYYSGGDTWTFFGEAIKLGKVAFTSFDSLINIYFKDDYSLITNYSYSLQPRAAFMTKILAPLTIITDNNYWLTSCYISLFSFMGYWILANNLYKILGVRWMAVIPTLFFPSIVFWSSGVMKESVAMGAMAAVVGIFIKIYLEKKVALSELFVLVLGLILLLFLKYYFAAILIVSILSLFLSRLTIPVKVNWLIEIGLISTIFVLILIIASFTHPNFYPPRILFVLVENYKAYHAASNGNNVVVFNNLAPDITSFLVHAPKALLSGMFFPLWYADFTIFRVLAVVENWVILLVFLFSLKYLALPKNRDLRILVLTAVLFIIISAIFITFSTPNLGTLTRYKIGYSVVFIVLVTTLLRNKIDSKILK